MKWSKFIFKFNESDNVILFNTYNKATILLDYKEYKLINEYLYNNTTCNINKKYINSLKELAFLIDNEYDEKANFYKELYKTVNRTDKFNIVILTTTNCNFKCSYCYEKGILKNNSFKIENINKIIKTLEYCIDFKKIKEIELTLFGGEPTLNWHFTTILLKEVQLFCDNNNIKLIIDMITNGYLLDSTKIDVLLNYNISNIQITLDGKKDVHDSRRMLLNGNNTFDRIINNIKYILSTNILRITIRINYDKSNADRIIEFIDYLEKEFFYFKNKIKLSFGIIDLNLKNDNKKDVFNYKEDLESYYLIFYNKLLQSGFKFEKYFQTGSICMAKRNNSIIISPDNNIYKCLSLVGTKETKIDDFKVEINNKVNYLNSTLYEECFNRQCEFIPMCYTGCRYKSFVNDMSLETKNCEYELLSKINSEIIKSLYKL